MAIAIDSPQYSVLVQPDNEQVLFMALLISTSSTMQQFYLCRSDGYTTAAREMHDKIMQAGKEMKRAESGLVVAKGSLDGIVPQAQGRERNGSRRPR